MGKWKLHMMIRTISFAIEVEAADDPATSGLGDAIAKSIGADFFYAEEISDDC